MSIEGAMPLLRERLQLDKPLEVYKSPGRFCSGPLIILASKSEKDQNLLDKLRRQTKLAGAYHEKYLALTQGSPDQNVKEECADIRLEKTGGKNWRGGVSYEVPILIVY